MHGSRVRIGLLSALCLVLAFAIGCSRPGEKRCTEVCEHFVELRLDAEFAERIQTVATDVERAALQKDRDARRAEIREQEAKGFEVCVNRCNRRSRGEVADCVMDAETLEQAKDCDGDEPSCGCTTGERLPDIPWGTALFGALAFGWLARRSA